MRRRLVDRFLVALYAAFVAPNTKRMEAYGRFAHNLTAAPVIAAMSIIFTENWYGLGHVLASFVAGLSCFVFGALLSRGE